MAMLVRTIAGEWEPAGIYGPILGFELKDSYGDELTVTVTQEGVRVVVGTY